MTIAWAAMSQALCKCCGYSSEQDRYDLHTRGSFSVAPQIKQRKKMLKSKYISWDLREKEREKKNMVKIKVGGHEGWVVLGEGSMSGHDRLQMLKAANT